MKKRVVIFIALPVFAVIQLTGPWGPGRFPDLLLLAVVFAGIFLGPVDGLIAGFLAGFIRSCFSPGMGMVEIPLLSISGYVLSFLSGMFYRRDIFFEILCVLAVFLLLLFSQVLYLNTFYSSELSFKNVLAAEWVRGILTTATGPFVFSFLSRLTGIKD